MRHSVTVWATVPESPIGFTRIPHRNLGHGPNAKFGPAAQILFQERSIMPLYDLRGGGSLILEVNQKKYHF